MTGYNADIDPWEIEPLHGPRLDYHDLTDDMLANGWQGRPLLVIERDEDYLAWTGSHRIAAARDAELETIPCYVLAQAYVGDPSMPCEDWERLEIVCGLGDQDAIELMSQENKI